MVKLIALYKTPQDQHAFDEHYYGTHTDVTKKIPGLRKMEVTKIVGSPMGESKYYLLCEMYYDNHEALQAGMKSAEGRASGKDLMSFAGDLVTMMIGEEVNG
ncbi:Ethyl tert-butyl ether degradation EthD [Fictibacillus macauensis ZFHKF-1]|uniref:Ethyl tert-butyl ether degradation EthD n=1 Tax=Fictibacillus macauensis ZFHKF-1 TaxID=1196324 RepID=I8J247_9BACL|nr:EthD family reductase [Fictibacillus macauensis]EIT85821.1 Ethyl tert-butyl ether degradation EthD [Fictibacillus macauensis ZFHKF-1]